MSTTSIGTDAPGMAAGAHAKRQTLLAILYLAGASISWGVGPVAICYIRSYSEIDGHTQNFFRFLCGAVPIGALWAARLASGRSAPKWTVLAAALIPVIPNVVNQTCWALSFYHNIEPTLGSLVINTNVFFAVAISFCLYRDERRVIRNPWFLGGLVAVVAGAAGVVLFQGNSRLGDPTVGLWLVLGSAFAWACYSLMIKPIMQRCDATAAFVVVGAASTVALGALSATQGRPETIAQASPTVLAVVVVSGAVCIGMAHLMYFKAIQIVGVAVSACVTLSQVAVTYVISFFLFDERLTAGQSVCGVLLLAGCAATLWTRESGRSAPGQAGQTIETV